jgi:uncharacterized membrane-anchored protein
LRLVKSAGLALALVLAAVPANLAAQGASMTEQQVEAMVAALKPQHGKIALPNAEATLDLGSGYDFYGPDDARKIIVEIWGNPPDSGEGVLGLVMPAGKSPLTDAWGAVVTFQKTGYVSDSDAAEVDYAELLSQMREGETQENIERKAAGYPEIHLAGWAEQPNYDKVSHSVVWAQDLAFAGSPNHSLNYDVRTLGRTGVLSLNLVSSLPKLGEVRTAARDFATHASFNPGARYADFNAATDDKAEYGIGGLIAAGVGVAVVKKLGILAIIAKFFASFFKPILIAVVAGFAAFKKKLAGLFGRNKDPLEGE